MEKKTIVARVEVLPGKEQEFISKAEPLIQETRNEEEMMKKVFVT